MTGGYSTTTDRPPSQRRNRMKPPLSAARSHWPNPIVVPGSPRLAGRHLIRSKDVLHAGGGEDLGSGQSLDQEPPHVVAGRHGHREHRGTVGVGGEEFPKPGVLLGPGIDVRPALPVGHPFGVGVAEHEGGVGEDGRMPVGVGERMAKRAGREAEPEIHEGVDLPSPHVADGLRQVGGDRRDRGSWT